MSEETHGGDGLEEHGIEEHGLEEHGIEEHGIEEHGIEEHGIEEHGIEEAPARKSTATTSRKRVSGSARRPLPGAHRVGAVASDEPVEVTVIVRPREPLPAPDELGRQPLRERRYLSRREFAARYGADRKDLAALEEFAREHGLHVRQASAARRSVVLAGPAAPDAGRVLHAPLSLPLAGGRLPRTLGPPPRPGRGRAGDRGGARPRRPAAGDRGLSRRPAGASRPGPQDLLHAAARRRAVRLPAPPRRQRTADRGARARRRLPPLPPAALLRKARQADAEDLRRLGGRLPQPAGRQPQRGRRGRARHRGDRRHRPGRRAARLLRAPERPRLPRRRDDGALRSPRPVGALDQLGTGRGGVDRAGPARARPGVHAPRLFSASRSAPRRATTAGRTASPAAWPTSTTPPRARTSSPAAAHASR